MAGPATVGHEPALVHRPDPVDPDAVQAYRRRVEPAGPGGQVADPALLATTDRPRVEEHQIGPGARLQPASLPDSVGVGHRAGDRAHRLLEREVAALACPVAEEVQSEARIAEEGQVGARVGERDGRVGMPEQTPDLVLIDVEEPAVEHGVQLTVETEIEEGIPRVLTTLAGQGADGLALE